MAGVCYVERQDVWCLIIFVVLMIAQNSLRRLFLGVSSVNTQKGTVYHTCSFWTAFSREGWVQQPLRETGIEGIPLWKECMINRDGK